METSLIFGKYFLQFDGPIEQFDIRRKVFVVGLTTPSPHPDAKGLAKLNHIYGITTYKCIAECFHHCLIILTF